MVDHLAVDIDSLTDEEGVNEDLLASMVEEVPEGNMAAPSSADDYVDGDCVSN